MLARKDYQEGSGVALEDEVYEMWKTQSPEFRQKYYSPEDNANYTMRFAQEQDREEFGFVDETEAFPKTEGGINKPDITGSPSTGSTTKAGDGATTFSRKKPIITIEEKEVEGKAMGGRMTYQEGSLMMPPEMESDMPVDTYPNIPPEEMDEAMASQLPDADMEDKYLDFVLEESLDDEEQSYLMNALEADPKLSQIFDKVVATASEFTGAGEVEGPGTGVSDSIPARLSDGEFVFTKKATDQMGADNLQMMMDDAERAFDGGQMRESAETGGLLLYNQEDDNPLAYEKIAQDEIKKNMLRSNRAPSLMAG